MRERAHKGTGDPPARRAILNPLYIGPSTLNSPELLTSSGDVGSGNARPQSQAAMRARPYDRPHGEPKALL